MPGGCSRRRSGTRAQARSSPTQPRTPPSYASCTRNATSRPGSIASGPPCASSRACRSGRTQTD
eukprot:3896853-Prorocentrum_lima.AAC.1